MEFINLKIFIEYQLVRHGGIMFDICHTAEHKTDSPCPPKAYNIDDAIGNVGIAQMIGSFGMENCK